MTAQQNHTPYMRRRKNATQTTKLSLVYIQPQIASTNEAVDELVIAIWWQVIDEPNREGSRAGLAGWLGEIQF